LAHRPLHDFTVENRQNSHAINLNPLRILGLGVRFDFRRVIKSTKKSAKPKGGGRRKDDSVNLKIPHLQQRGQRWRYRRNVPADSRMREQCA
jgi:hypothetical protein